MYLRGQPRYRQGARMGLHQDKDESPASIAAGLPVVSISLGDTARFLFGGLKRRDPVEARLLGSPTDDLCRIDVEIDVSGLRSRSGCVIERQTVRAGVADCWS